MIKEFLKDKGIGFYFTAAVTLLLLVTAITHIASYVGSEYMSWPAFVLCLVGFVAGVALIVTKQYRFVSIVLGVVALWSMLLFMHAIYYYVSIVATGIDLESVDARFVMNTIFFALTFVLAVTNVFLRQQKSGEELA